MIERPMPVFLVWSPIPLRPWGICTDDGRSIRRFRDFSDALAVMQDPVKLRRAVAAWQKRNARRCTDGSK